MKKLILALLFCIITAFTILPAIADILPNPEFTITTIDMPAGTEFSFTMSAQGDFVVDWGDGNIDTIVRTNTTETTYSHTYESGGVYTIGMSGQATGYTTTGVISFASNTNVAGIDGSLGAIFGTIGTSQPRFDYTFDGCSNLTGLIPANLFNGITGAPVSSMFSHTFQDCSGLTGSIPEKLFAGINGAPASLMFYGTFEGCSGLTGNIPEKLFAGIKGAPVYAMFDNTFYHCSGLTGSIPENLFVGLSGAPADWMFCRTFAGCSGLTGSIPAKLFVGISGAPAGRMFIQTFDGCSGLTGSIPEKLFAGIKGAPAERMFRQTFYGCRGLTGYIPYDLFAGTSGGPRASEDFTYTFYGTNLAKSCSANMYQATINTEPSFNSLDGHAICAACPTGTISPAGAVSIKQCVCPENTYMGTDICNTCPTGLASPMGSKDSGSCGRKLHIGDETLYLRSSKKTTPSLNVDINNDGIADFFGNATTQRTTINNTSQRYLHVGEYYIYDDSIKLEE